jgi:hypothetical protein
MPPVTAVQSVLTVEVGLCALAGAAVGLVIPIRLGAARAMRVLEGSGMAALFGGLFMLGSGRPGEDAADPVPVAAATAGVVFYFVLVGVIARWLARRAARGDASVVGS